MKILNEKDIITKYQNGETMYSIAKDLGVYEQRISNLLKRNNVHKKHNPFKIDVNYFNTIDTDLKAYFLGFITADGCICKNKKGNVKTLTISIHEKDLIVLEKLKEELKAEISIKYLKNNQVRFHTSQKELIIGLEKYGIEEKKSLTMGNLINNIPLNYRNAFIRGYFDGDGSIFIANIKGEKPHKQKYVSIRGTKPFLQGILDQLSFEASISFSSGQHMLRFGKKEKINEFKEYIYKNSQFHLERKFEIFD